jgi:hypothetical protein
MFDRASRTELVDKLLCAGTLLSLCSLIILGPRPQRMTFEPRATVETVGSAPDKNPFRIEVSGSIRQSS